MCVQRAALWVLLAKCLSGCQSGGDVRCGAKNQSWCYQPLAMEHATERNLPIELHGTSHSEQRHQTTAQCGPLQRSTYSRCYTRLTACVRPSHGPACCVAMVLATLAGSLQTVTLTAVPGAHPHEGRTTHNTQACRVSGRGELPPWSS